MKTKEQVLAIGTLSAQQRQRAEAFFQAAERFKKPLQINANTNDEVKKFLDDLQKKYDKRKAAEAKKKEKQAAKNEETKAVLDLIAEAKKYEFTTEDVISAVKDIIKERKNAAIQAQIKALQAQLL